ncbi:MAG: ROK family protein, partial [Butyricicoccus sp.]
FETYTSATGLIRLAREAMEQDQTSVLHDWTRETKLNAKMICDACDAGDALAQRVFSEYCDYLACGLTNLVNVFQPDSIVIGGGVAGYGEKLFAPLRERVHAEQFHVASEGTPIVGAMLGNDAGIIGAALL